MGFTVNQASRLYDIEAIDYLDDGRCPYGRENDWLLVAAGTGLMLSIMDIEPRFRYCLDVDTLPREAFTYRLPQWLVMMEANVERIAVAGWYSNPQNAAPLLGALQVLTRKTPVYIGGQPDGADFGTVQRIRSLEEFFTCLESSTAALVV